jgi:hypothetical protein
MKKSLPRRLSVAIAALAPGLLAAQPVTMPTAENDVLVWEAAATVENHSNIFAIPGGPRDTVIRGVLGTRFEREVSLQRVTVNASLEPTKFIDFSEYDYVGYRAGVNWDWAIGRPLFGQLTARAARFQTSFYDADFGANNLEKLFFVRGLGGFRITQSWSVFAAADHQRVTNSEIAQRQADNDVLGLEAGLRFIPGTGSEFDFFYRRAEGDYRNRQVLDAAGNPLPGAIDNAYTQDALLSRIAYAPSDRSRITGQAGWTRRQFENLPQRDFSGPTVGLGIDWAMTGATTLRADVIRTIVSDEALTSNYVDVQTLALRPTMRPTARITLDALVSFSRRAYEGDPGFVLLGGPVRRDRLNELGLRGNYEIARRIFSYVELRRVDRSSNYDRFEFTDNIVGVGVRGQF